MHLQSPTCSLKSETGSSDPKRGQLVEQNTAYLNWYSSISGTGTVNFLNEKALHGGAIDRDLWCWCGLCGLGGCCRLLQGWGGCRVSPWQPLAVTACSGRALAVVDQGCRVLRLMDDNGRALHVVDSHPWEGDHFWLHRRHLGLGWDCCQVLLCMSLGWLVLLLALQSVSCSGLFHSRVLHGLGWIHTPQQSFCNMSAQPNWTQLSTWLAHRPVLSNTNNKHLQRKGTCIETIKMVDVFIFLMLSAVWFYSFLSQSGAQNFKETTLIQMGLPSKVFTRLQWCTGSFWPNHELQWVDFRVRMEIID